MSTILWGNKRRKGGGEWVGSGSGIGHVRGNGRLRRRQQVAIEEIVDMEIEMAIDEVVDAKRAVINILQ